MKEKSLLKISLICSITGIMLLFFISESAEIGQESIGDIVNDIDFSGIGRDVKIKGIVSKIADYEKSFLIEIVDRDDNRLNIVLFKKGADETIQLENDDSIEVIGEIDEYNGKIQIIGNEIRKVTT